MTGIRRVFEKGRFPLHREEEDVTHILLKYSETTKWKETFLSSKCLNINEVVAYKRILNCTNVADIRNIEKYLYKIRCKWQNKVSNI
jgi:hypothetical protein